MSSVRRGSIADVDALMPLWVAMVEHHRLVAGDEWPVRDAGAAWEIRRAEYQGWLNDGSGVLFLAGPGGEGEVTGYAMLRVHVPGATWDLGEQVGELESLAVAASARGAGLGTMLMKSRREELRQRGVGYWSVAVVEANEAAVRLYERSGFRSYYRLLLGHVDSATAATSR